MTTISSIPRNSLALLIYAKPTTEEAEAIASPKSPASGPGAVGGNAGDPALAGKAEKVEFKSGVLPLSNDILSVLFNSQTGTVSTGPAADPAKDDATKTVPPQPANDANQISNGLTKLEDGVRDPGGLGGLLSDAKKSDVKATPRDITKLVADKDAKFYAPLAKLEDLTSNLPAQASATASNAEAFAQPYARINGDVVSSIPAPQSPIAPSGTTTSEAKVLEKPYALIDSGANGGVVSSTPTQLSPIAQDGNVFERPIAKLDAYQTLNLLSAELDGTDKKTVTSTIA